MTKQTLATQSSLDQLLMPLRRNKGPVTLDIESNSLDYIAKDSTIVGLAIYDPEADQAIYFPLTHNFTANIPLDLLPEIEDAVSHREHIYHNAKFDLHFLRRYGWKHGATHDTMIMAKIRDFRPAGLKDLTAELGFQQQTYESLTAAHGGQIQLLPASQVMDYVCGDVIGTWILFKSESEKLKGKRQEQIYRLEMKLLDVTIAMEETGLSVSREALESLRSQYESLKLSAESSTRWDIKRHLNCPLFQSDPNFPKPSPSIGSIEGICPKAQSCNKSNPTCEFPIHSTQKLADLLFGWMKIPTEGVRATKKSFSTDSDTLHHLQAKTKYRWLQSILDYKEAIKGAGMVETYLEAVDHDGRIHPDLLQVHVISGRYGCASPNMQQAPKSRRGQGSVVSGFRTAFVASENHYLLSIDYQQIEMRIFAALAQAAALLKAFADGVDVHKQTASLTFKIPLEAVTKDQRDLAKTVGFGAIYGQQSRGLAAKINIPELEAERIQNAFFAGIPEFAAYVARTKSDAHRQSGIYTRYGRWVPIPEIHARRYWERASAERLAVNATIQGSAADVHKLSLIKAHAAIQAFLGTKILLPIHDEILFEVPNEFDVKSVAKVIMDSITIEFDGVTLTTDAEFGKNWDDMAPVFPREKDSSQLSTDIHIDLDHLTEDEIRSVMKIIQSTRGDDLSLSISSGGQIKIYDNFKLEKFAVKLLSSINSPNIKFGSSAVWDDSF